MKKAIGIIILGLLLSSGVKASELVKGATVNSLMAQGYKLVSTDSVGLTFTDDQAVSNIYYHLQKNRELITCMWVIGIDITTCYKP